jgi:membrane protease YdiL (CAAX protease family)
MKMFLRVVVFYGLTWFFLIFLGGIQQASGLLPPQVGLAQLAPGIAAFMMLIFFRKDGFKIVFSLKGIPSIRYFLAALIPLGVGLIVLFVSSVIISVKPEPRAMYDPLWLIVLWMPLGAIGEETGWRGYLNKMLDKRLRGIVSAILVGLLWMPIHVGFFAEGPIYILFLTLSIVSYSLVIYTLVQDTGFNVILATIFHLFINLTNLLFLDVIHTIPFMMVNGVVWLIVAAVVVLSRRNVYFTPKRKEFHSGVIQGE